MDHLDFTRPRAQYHSYRGFPFMNPSRAFPCVSALILALLVLPLAALRAADGSLSFDGVDDFVEVPEFHTLDVTNEVAVEFWAKADVLKQQSALHAQSG